MRIYGILLKVKRPCFNPYKLVTWPSAGRLAGRPRQKSVDQSDRLICINVHRHFGWWAGRPTRSTARELCSLDLAPVDRWHNGRKSNRWHNAGRPTAGNPAELDHNGYIF